MANNKQIAADVLAAVGGKENVTFVTHCITRLRFNLADRASVNDETVKAVKGVLGVVESGGQYQVIIGQNVPKVYEELCRAGGFAVQKAVEENLDKPKEPLTPKKLGSAILSYLAGISGVMLPAWSRRKATCTF